MWFKRCNHNWKDESVKFQPPPDRFEFDGGRARGQAANELVALMRRMTFGQTTVVQRCTLCNQTKGWTVTGDAR